MLKTAPDLVTSNDQLVSAGGDIGDMGITTPPKGTSAPTFSIEPNGKCTRKVSLLKKANPGTNTAAYLAPGYYPSGKGCWNPGENEYLGGYSQAFCPEGEIISVLWNAESQRSELAEQEHCNDILRAYRITIGAVEKAIQSINGRSFKGQTAKKAFTKAVLALCDQVPYELQKLFRKATEGGQVDNATFSKDLLALFTRTCDLTAQRDARGHHTFSLKRPGKIQTYGYWLSSNYWNVVRGPNFQVPGLATADLIKL